VEGGVVASETGRNDSKPHQTETRRPRDTRAVLSVHENESRREEKRKGKESRDSVLFGLVESILEFCSASQARSLCHGPTEFTFIGFCCGPEAAFLIQCAYLGDSKLEPWWYQLHQSW